MGIKWLLAFLCLTAVSYAATVNAASCSDAAVQSSINSASAGDVVVVPAGSCTWTTTVTIASKNLLLQGGGIGTTNITDQGASGAALSVTGVSDVNFVRVTAFTWIKDTNHSNGIVQFIGSDSTNAGELVGFRFDHNRILEATTGSRGMSVASIMGLIDNNAFDITATSGSNQVILVDGSVEGSDGGWTPWTQALTLGSNKAVYVEDNTFTVSLADAGVEDQIDAYAGARLVIRHNQFINSTVGFHGTDSGGLRGLFSAEVYSNTFTNNAGSALRAGSMRSGTGVWYNNTYNGSGGGFQNILMTTYRSCALLASGYGWGYAGPGNGASWQLQSIDHTSNAGRINSTNSADFIASHVYAANSTVIPATNNAGSFNFQTVSGGTSGTYPGSWNQTMGGTTTDSGGVVWTNLGGGLSGSGAKWCSNHPDTACTADATCTPGTCTRFFDGSGAFGYPIRDQIGRTHDQVLAPVYAWNNGSPVIAVNDGNNASCDAAMTSVMASGVDYKNATVMPAYSPYMYPHILQGMVPAPARGMF